MRIIVNASGASHGGAREILRRYLEFIKYDNSNEYFVICPCIREFSEWFLRDHIKFIQIKTSGAFTYLFSSFFIIYHVIHHKANKVVSLNNINLVIGVCSRVTYFHQEKAITGNGLRFYLIRKNIHITRNSLFIVQSRRIRENLVNILGLPYENVIVKWPGVRSLEAISKKEALKYFIELAGKDTFSDGEHINKRSKFAFLPVYDHRSEHKNFVFFEHLKRVLNSLGYLTISLCSDVSKVADINLGVVTTKEMDTIYSLSDLLVIISKKESLCLPIFEFSQTGRPVIAMKAPYIDEFKVDFSSFLKNVYVIPQDASDEMIYDTVCSVSQVSISDSILDNITHGQWDI